MRFGIEDKSIGTVIVEIPDRILSLLVSTPPHRSIRPIKMDDLPGHGSKSYTS